MYPKTWFTAAIINFRHKRRTPGEKKAVNFKGLSLQLEQESDGVCCALRHCNLVLFYLTAVAIVL